VGRVAYIGPLALAPVFAAASSAPAVAVARLAAFVGPIAAVFGHPVAAVARPVGFVVPAVVFVVPAVVGGSPLGGPFRRVAALAQRTGVAVRLVGAPVRGFVVDVAPAAPVAVARVITGVDGALLPRPLIVRPAVVLVAVRTVVEVGQLVSGVRGCSLALGREVEAKLVLTRIEGLPLESIRGFLSPRFSLRDVWEPPSVFSAVRSAFLSPGQGVKFAQDLLSSSRLPQIRTE
jgi:hypothetical protein